MPLRNSPVIPPTRSFDQGQLRQNSLFSWLCEFLAIMKLKKKPNSGTPRNSVWRKETPKTKDSCALAHRAIVLGVYSDWGGGPLDFELRGSQTHVHAHASRLYTTRTAIWADEALVNLSFFSQIRRQKNG